jgi:general secretion pathway protein D
MTPYIIRSQSDLRTVFERKMQERQEYLDRYFVFSEVQEYNPPKDWSRTNGLVEDIRQSYFKLDERRRLDEIARPKDIKSHDPQQPLEMPQGIRPQSSGAGEHTETPATPTRRPPRTTEGAAPPAGGAAPAPPVNVNPPARNIER